MTVRIPRPASLESPAPRFRQFEVPTLASKVTCLPLMKAVLSSAANYDFSRANRIFVGFWHPLVIAADPGHPPARAPQNLPLFLLLSTLCSVQICRASAGQAF